jgi:CheY-like chemotaxis protein
LVLVGNAVKYTSQGGITLRTKSSIKKNETVLLRIEIEDTGSGISDSDKKNIFSPFIQVNSNAANVGGVGLGLAICKQYVEAMGGIIGVENSPQSQGAIFYFEIPVTIIRSEITLKNSRYSNPIGLEKGTQLYKMLIAEDNPDNRRLLAGILLHLGFEMREVENGYDAVKVFEEWKPDLIWMDIRMPIMDGLQATKKIKETRAGAKTKIIVLTAHALETERLEIIKSGCDDFIRKPYRESEIYDAIQKHLKINYTYANADKSEMNRNYSIEPYDLKKLPIVLITDLSRAIEILDIDGCKEIIEKIISINPDLGHGLMTMVKNMRIHEVLNLLEDSK